jgi:hypothetical protein
MGWTAQESPCPKKRVSQRNLGTWFTGQWRSSSLIPVGRLKQGSRRSRRVFHRTEQTVSSKPEMHLSPTQTAIISEKRLNQKNRRWANHPGQVADLPSPVAAVPRTTVFCALACQFFPTGETQFNRMGPPEPFGPDLQSKPRTTDQSL